MRFSVTCRLASAIERIISKGCLITTGSGKPTMTGQQPVSVYIVHVVLPIGSGGETVQIPSATPSDTSTEVTTTIVARSKPTKSSMLPVTAKGALAHVAILGFSRREQFYRPAWLTFFLWVVH